MEGKYLNDDELALVKAMFDRYRYKCPRDILMLELLLYSGARACELLALRGCDVLRSYRSIRLRAAKLGKDRNIPLPDALFDRLAAYSADFEPSERIFPITYNRLRDIWAFFRPVPRKMHSLRHTFAICVYKRTKDPRLVQRALGHRHFSTTMIYQDYVFSIEEMRQILE